MGKKRTAKSLNDEEDLEELFKMGFVSLEEVDSLTPQLIRERTKGASAAEIELECQKFKGAITTTTTTTTTTSEWEVTRLPSKQVCIESERHDESKKEENQTKNKYKKKRSMVKRKPTLENTKPTSAERINEIELLDKDLPNWREFKLDDKILCGLKHLGFVEPTPIQKNVLKELVQNDWKRDILGSAPTGSGKTLAFVLPIMNYLIAKQKLFQDSTDQLHRLTALILVPTRELALQIQKGFLGIGERVAKLAVLVGGMSIEKQERLLSGQPDVIIATPGRLMEMVQFGSGVKKMIRRVKYLVIDEADRMVEKGHFKELDDILAVLFADRQDDVDLDDKNAKDPPSPNNNSNRRILLFSATLNFQNPNTSSGGKRAKSPLDILFAKIKFNDPNPAMICENYSKLLANPATLTQYKEFCLKEEKDSFFVAYLLQTRARNKETGKFGRVLVFVNTIDAIARLVPLLQLIKLPALGLHAQMQQRQRLKNLDRFSASNEMVLIASDVAARGLDIKNVDHVIHFDIPTKQQVYVHRCGRTARGNRSGTSLALIGPQERNQAILCMSSSKVDTFETPLPLIEKTIRPMMILANKIAAAEHDKKVQSKNESWFEKAADEFGIILDENDWSGRKKSRGKIIDDDGSERRAEKSLEKKLAAQKGELELFIKSIEGGKLEFISWAIK